MKRSYMKPSRFDNLYETGLSSLPARSRKKRKRHTSKQRRVQLKHEIYQEEENE